MMKKNAVIVMGKRSVAIAILLVLTLTIFISVASAATTTYDYSSGVTTDKWAWEVNSDDIPPDTVNSETALSSDQYVSIGTSDTNRWQMSDPGANKYISMKSTIEIQESAATITNILFHVEAYTSASQPKTVAIYGYNKNTPGWDIIGSGVVPKEPDGTVEASLTANFDDYIEADGKMTWCFILDYKNQFLYVNYVKVDVTYITPTWLSYNDPLYENPDDIFSGDEHTVYMKGTGFLSNHQYRVAYYDAPGVKTATAHWLENDDVDSVGEILKSDCAFTAFKATADAGDWHAIVCERTAPPPPSTYDSGWAYIIADKSFNVEDTAIPEFPTVIAAIAVCMLCAVAYVVMRRRVGRGDG